MKKYGLLFIFLFTSGFLMAQFTKTITEKDGSTRTITVTTDQSLRKTYSEEVHDKNGQLTSKSSYKKNLRNQWEVEFYETKLDEGETEYKINQKIWFNEKGEITRLQWYDDGKPGMDHRRDSAGGLVVRPKPKFAYDDEYEVPLLVEAIEYGYGLNLEWLDNLDENSIPPPRPDYNKLGNEKLEQLFEEDRKKCKEKKVGFYLGPSFLNGDLGSGKESFFGGQVYGLVSINANIGVGADFSLNSKKDGNQKFTRSLFLARGQYDFFTGDHCDKRIIPEAHALIGLGSESFKTTFNGNTTKSNGSGLAYGVGAGVGINLSPTIDLGLSVDYVGINFENTDSANSNIRASAGIIVSLGGRSQNNITFKDW